MRLRIDLARIDWARPGAAGRRGIGRAGHALAALTSRARRLARVTLTALGNAARSLLRTPPARRRQQSVLRRHLIVNLVLGLTIELALHQFHGAAPLQALEDQTMDWAMGLYRGTAAPAGARPIAFIDIDAATYRDWGEPLITPRDRLAALVQHAIAGGAAAIVLDLDLSRPGGPGDAALRHTLAAYRPDAQGRAPDLPPLILVRTIRTGLPGPADTLPTERATPFDAPAAQAPGIHWAAPLFVLDADGRVRRWHLWAATCGADGRPLVRPSIQLLLAALLDADPDQRTALAESLAGLVPADCTRAAPAAEPPHGSIHSADHPASAAGTLTLGGRRIHLQAGATATRIRYRLPWHLGPGESRPGVLLAGQRVPELAVRPAAAVVGVTDPAGAAWLRGQVVIIGASHPDIQDLYQTPLGWLPGALIVVNAVQSLGHQGELQTPGLAGSLALAAGLITTMSLLFARFHSFLGSLLSGLTVLLVLLPISLWLLGSGVWIGFALPLVAVLVHRLFADLEEAIAEHQAKETHHD